MEQVKISEIEKIIAVVANYTKGYKKGNVINLKQKIFILKRLDIFCFF